MDVSATFRLVAPEFEKVSDDDVAKWIDLCKPFVSKQRFGNLYDQALALLAAHRMKISGRYEAPDTAGILNLAGSGRVASYTEGQTSISFQAGGAGSGSSGAKNLEASEYGREYLDLCRLKIVPILISH